MEIQTFFKKAISENFRTIDVSHFENSQLVFIVVDSDNKTYWRVTIYGDEFEFDFYVNYYDSEEELNKEIQRLLQLPCLIISDLESFGYML
jgi:hypothetical protein